MQTAHTPASTGIAQAGAEYAHPLDSYANPEQNNAHFTAFIVRVGYSPLLLLGWVIVITMQLGLLQWLLHDEAAYVITLLTHTLLGLSYVLDMARSMLRALLAVLQHGGSWVLSLCDSFVLLLFSVVHGATVTVLATLTVNAWYKLLFNAPLFFD